MRRRDWGSRWIVASALSLGGVALTSSPAGAFPQAIQPMQVAPQPANARIHVHSSALPTAMSCADASDCSVLGVYQQGNVSSNYVPDFVSEHSGSWGTVSTAATPPTTSNPELSSISCWAPGECVAVGSILYGMTGLLYPWVVTQHQGVWNVGQTLPLPAGTINAGLKAVTCFGSTDCEAVGWASSTAPVKTTPIAVAEVAGVWGAIGSVTLPSDVSGTTPNGQLLGLSCSTPTSCTAVGFYNNASSAESPLIATGSGATFAAEGGLSLPSGAAGGALLSVACTAVNGCLAVGNSYGTSSTGLAATNQLGSWSLSTEDLGATATTLNAVDCSDDGGCVVGGQGKISGTPQAVAASVSAGAWSSVSVTPPSGAASSSVVSVACFSSGTCTLAESVSGIGGPNPSPYVVPMTSGIFGAPVALPIPDDVGVSGDTALSTLACPSHGQCVAFGIYVDSSLQYDLYAQNLTNGVAGVALQIASNVPAAPTGLKVICTDQADCLGLLAGNRTTTVLVESAGIWTTATPFPAGDELVALSCAGPSVCTAVGTDQVHHVGITATLTSGTWTVPAPIAMGNVSALYPTSLDEISCWAPGSCEAVGTVGKDPFYWDQVAMAITETAGVWGLGTLPAAWPHSYLLPSIPSGVACASDGTCVTVGMFHGSAASSQLQAGTWSAPHLPSLPIGASSADFVGVTCPDAGDCVAGGNFVDSFGAEQGFWALGSLVPGSSLSTNFVGIQLTAPYSGIGDPLTTPMALTDISCATASDCAVVGSYYSSGANVNRVPLFAMTGTPPPAAPVSLHGVPHNGSVTVSWSAPPNNGSPAVTSYTASINGHTCTTAGTSCTVTGLVNGNHYSATVFASNDVGQGPAASSIDVFAAAPPQAPTNLATSFIPGGVSITASPPLSDGGSPVTSYHFSIYFNGRILDGGNVLNLNDPDLVAGLPNGASIRVGITATNVSGTSPELLTPLLQLPWLPTAPLNVMAVGAASSIAVSWSPSTSNGKPVTGYKVAVSTSTDMNPVVGQCSTTTLTKCLVSGLAPNSFYYVTVAAVNADGPNASNFVITGTSAHPPGAPGPVTSLSAVSTTTTASLKWKAPKKMGFGPDTYVVSQVSGGVSTPLGSTMGTSFKVSKLVAKTSYLFTVVGVAANGQLSTIAKLTVKTKS